MTQVLRALSSTRRAILMWIKTSGGATTAEVAAHLGVSDEGARQHLVFLESRGWVERQRLRRGPHRSGRPTARYTVTASGDALFPKRYDELAVVLVDTMVDTFGGEALGRALGSIVDREVAHWAPRLEGKSVEERLEELREFYVEDDPFATVEQDGGLVLVERNCPFRNVAIERPALCSTTVMTLARLLGCRVERLRRFQNGDGCCAFHVYPDQPIDPAAYPFRFEDEETAA